MAKTALKTALPAIEKRTVVMPVRPKNADMRTRESLTDDEVQRLANALKALGVHRGDRVNIYLPMIPEAVVAMLACARIGAPPSVVFGGFSAQSLSDRINDAEAKVLITADGGHRRGEVFPLKPAADEAITHTPTIEHVVVVRRGGKHRYFRSPQGSTQDEGQP